MVSEAPAVGKEHYSIAVQNAQASALRNNCNGIFQAAVGNLHAYVSEPFQLVTSNFSAFFNEKRKCKDEFRG
jgi:hypothetical protein